MMVHVNPQATLVSHSLSAYITAQVCGFGLVFVPDVNFEIVSIHKWLVAELAKYVAFLIEATWNVI